MTLADFFPSEEKSAFASRNLKVGAVIKLFNHKTSKKKEKRHVVVAIDSERVALAAILINSEVNEYVNYSPELQALHIACSALDREYLSHDSFFDCSSLFELDINSVESIIKEDPIRVLGEVSDEDMRLIREKVTQSPKIKGKVLKRLGFYNPS